MDSVHNDILTDEEMEKAVLAYMEGVSRPCSEEELLWVVDKIRELKVAAGLFDLIMNGKLVMVNRDNDLAYIKRAGATLDP